jgi:hypothetical protein
VTRILVLTALLLTLAATVGGCGGATPKYALSPSAKCFRTLGYRVSAGNGSAHHRWITLRKHGYEDLGVYFAPTAATAQRYVARQNVDVGMPRSRNVVFDVEGSLKQVDSALGSCLRSR